MASPGGAVWRGDCDGKCAGRTGRFSAESILSFPLFGLKKQKLWGFLVFWGVETILLEKPLQGGFRSRGGPREAQEPPRVTRRCGQGAKRAAERPQKRPRGGPAYGSRGHKSREAKARRYK